MLLFLFFFLFGVCLWMEVTEDDADDDDEGDDVEEVFFVSVSLGH